MLTVFELQIVDLLYFFSNFFVIHWFHFSFWRMLESVLYISQFLSSFINWVIYYILIKIVIICINKNVQMVNCLIYLIFYSLLLWLSLKNCYILLELLSYYSLSLWIWAAFNIIATTVLFSFSLFSPSAQEKE